MANYKRIFLDGYSYYLTVVTHRRNPILIDNIHLLRQAFAHSKERLDYRIDAIVILPDHFHMIITPQYAADYPAIISAIKRYFTKHCEPKHYHHLEQSASRQNRGLKPVWQKRFYEHTIRNEKDLDAKLRYIYHNPIKHRYTDTLEQWEYTSFRPKLHGNSTLSTK